MSLDPILTRAMQSYEGCIQAIRNGDKAEGLIGLRKTTEWLIKQAIQLEPGLANEIVEMTVRGNKCNTRNFLNRR